MMQSKPRPLPLSVSPGVLQAGQATGVKLQQPLWTRLLPAAVR